MVADAPAPEGSQTLDRGLRALELLAAPEHLEGLTMTALAAALGVSRPAAYRLVATLSTRGYVAKAPDGRVRLGWAAARLSVSVRPGLRAAALPVLRQLADEVGATAHLTLADGDEALALAVVEPTWSDLHVAYREGRRHPLGLAAAGHAILAGREGRTAAVSSDGELQPGAHGVAAPLPGGRLEASVGVVALAPLDLGTAGRRVEEAAQRLSALLA